MGWIKALKRGAPAEQRVETMTTSGFVPDPNIPVCLVDSSAGVISNSKLSKPNAGPGYIKTFIQTAGTADITLQAVQALKRETHGGSYDVATITEVGGVARFLWDGDKWSIIAGGDVGIS